MGLLADYVEANRERVYNGDIDPCMIMSSRMYRYKSLRKKLDEYCCLDDETYRKKLLVDELQERVKELERIKAGYILGEKAILEVINRGNVSSSMIYDSLQELCLQMHQAYCSACDILQELDLRLMNTNVHQLPDIDERTLRLHILNLLLNGMVDYINSDTELDISGFRKMISDCASMIRLLEDEAYLMADKVVVQHYMIRHFSISKSAHRCFNCKEALYTGIPFCMNCYERNREHE